jgi:DNA-binding NtrC family response regulator
VIDDEPILLDSLSRVLRRYGYHVLSAECARQALKILNEQTTIDVVLSDVVMPEMRGPELVRECVRIAPYTACVLMTASVIDISDIPPGVPLLRKPMPKTELLAAIEAAVARSAECKSNFQPSIGVSAA